MRSRNLIDWEELPPVLLPGDGTDMDQDGCWTGSVIYAEGKYHLFYTAYHIDADFPQMLYRYSKSPYGPWRTPKFDGIDNRRFYAAKSKHLTARIISD